MTEYEYIRQETETQTSVEDDGGGAVRLCYRMMSRTQSVEVPESPLKKSLSSGLSNKFVAAKETITEEYEEDANGKGKFSRISTGTSIESVFDKTPNFQIPNGLTTGLKKRNFFFEGSTESLDECSKPYIGITDKVETEETNCVDDIQNESEIAETLIVPEISVPLRNSSFPNGNCENPNHVDIPKENDIDLKYSTLSNGKCENSDSFDHNADFSLSSKHGKSEPTLSKIQPHALLHRVSDVSLQNTLANIGRRSSSVFGSLMNLVVRRRSTDLHMDNDYWIKEYKCFDLFLALFGIGFFLADVVSDWRLAFVYYFDEQIPLFALTVIFIVVPSLISAIITIIWSAMDHQVYKAHIESKRSRHMRKSKTFGDNLLLILKVIFSIFQLGRCFRGLVFIVYVIRSWCTPAEHKVKLHILKKKALEQKHDAAILGLIDGFMESSSQFMLQMYLSISYNLEMDFLRIATICLSFVSSALLQTSYYKNNRKVQKYKPNVGFLGGAVYFLWRLCELGPRFFVLVLFTYCFRYWVIIPIVLQLSLVFAIFIYQKPKLKGICCTPTFDYFFCLLVSYIGIFCFVNLKSGRTRYGLLIYYIMFYVQNFTMAALILVFWSLGEGWQSPHVTERWKYGTVLLIPGILLHLFFMLLYYHMFHPRKKRKSGSGNRRRLCKDVTLCGIQLV